MVNENVRKKLDLLNDQEAIAAKISELMHRIVKNDEDMRERCSLISESLSILYHAIDKNIAVTNARLVRALILHIYTTQGIPKPEQFISYSDDGKLIDWAKLKADLGAARYAFLRKYESQPKNALQRRIEEIWERIQECLDALLS